MARKSKNPQRSIVSPPRGRKLESAQFIALHPKEGKVEWPWRRRVPRAWGEVKRASSCKGVSFSGSVVARSLPGIQLIVAWRVAPMRAAAAHGTRRASGGRGPRYRRGSSIDPRPRFIAAPCHAVHLPCVRSVPLSPSPARVRSSRMEARTEIEKVSRTHWPLPRSIELSMSWNISPSP